MAATGFWLGVASMAAPLASARIRRYASTRVCNSVVVSTCEPVMVVLASALAKARRLLLSTPLTPARLKSARDGAVLRAALLSA